MGAEQQAREPEVGRTAWLSIGFEELLHRLHKQPTVFDVVIVGSGYGGAVAAAELAGCTRTEDGKRISVCVLERGKEYLPGMFPSRLADLAGHVRFSTDGSSQPRGRREGLFDIRVGPDVNAVLANGLGGGSLINAGVMAQPHPSVFSDWPPSVGADLQGQDGFFTKARGLLGVDDRKDKWTGAKRKPAKLSAFERLAADAGGGPVCEAPITVAVQGGRNAEPVAVTECKLCGDCATGCNHGAKKSLDTNLLVRAWRTRNDGAGEPLTDIVTGATVLRIERGGDDVWLLHTAHTDDQLRKRQKEPAKLSARKVILAAGTFGSTEILLRSRSDQLRFSRRLGEHFSANGDSIAVVYGQNTVVNAVADESADPDRRYVGPTITGILDLRDQQNGQGHVIEEIAIPGPLRRVFEETVTTANLLHELERPDKSTHRTDEPAHDPCAVDAAAIGQSSLFVIMGDDGAAGMLELIGGNDKDHGDGAIRVRWPGLSNHRLFQHQLDALRELVSHSSAGGRVLPNPVWQLLPDKMQFLFDARRGPPLSVHPLGGCPMGKDVTDGVVNEFGQVFDAASDGPWKDLVVLDGSIVRGALGINPALTIAALALRAVRHLRDDIWKFVPPQHRDTRPLARPPFRQLTVETPRPTELQLVERMSGDAMLELQGWGALPFRVELELRFKKKSIAELVLPLNGQPVAMARTLEVESGKLRVYRKTNWDKWRLEGGGEEELKDIVELSAPLEGTLTLLHRQPSRSWTRGWRAWWAWFLNRGLRDSCQWLAQRWRSGELFTADTRSKIADRGRSSRALASRAGEVRHLEYRLFLKENASAGRRGTQLREASFVKGGGIVGLKRLTYERKGNPWRQLMQMELRKFPDLARKRPRLELDTKFLAGQAVPLLKIVSQNDQVSALADLASFACYFMRLLLNIHVWSFRRPDTPVAREPQRLPAAGIPGSPERLPEPEIREIDVDRLPDGTPVRVRLTRYRPRHPRGRPVVMIHGYSASGTTFAHHAVKPCMAEYFFKRDRDVWVLDLRTSSGMPTAPYPWAFEDAALADLPAAFDTIYRVLCHEKQRDIGPKCIDVFAHCMGSAMFSMAVLARPEPGAPFFSEREALPDLINRAVLCQISPVVVMSPANIFRGYAMSYVRHFLPFENYEFRVGPNPGLTDQLIDRFLATLPYPKEEFGIENPIWPWRSAAFVGTRHRMDALYGRDFSLADERGKALLDDQVLEHIDDLFGPLSIDTVAQAIHFARSEVITNCAGRNDYVLPRNFSRWNFPTLSIHGTENGLSDVATLERFRKRFEEDADIHIDIEPFKGFGHQDCLIGKKAPQVFEYVFDYFEGKKDARAN